MPAQCPAGNRHRQYGTVGVLAEVFHGIDDLGAVLHLVKNDERLFGQNLIAAGQHQILQNPIHILGSFKELFIFFVFIKVEISGIFILASAELFQNPSLSHLTHTFQDQRLAVG